MKQNSSHYGGGFDVCGIQTQLKKAEEDLSKPEIWNSTEKMTALLREKSLLEANLADYTKLEESYNNAKEWLHFAEEGEEDALISLDEAINLLQENIKSTQLALLLSGEDDIKDAILEIHPGAGGTEAQDWAEMLERMYYRFADRKNYKATILDYLAGDEAGIKSVTIRISGPYAYGHLKSEKGIHRLIRISPFDASGKRHTSFASVDVLPDIGDDIKIDIQESDLRIDVYRASGAGGQHVNKTESAVRITHIPTGIVAQCQNDKSQHSNKDSAMRLLKARLYEHEQQKRNQVKQADYAGKNAIAFGSQIRSYTLQPHRLVKDHRTNTALTDVDAVLDGNILPFINDFLLFNYESDKKID